MNRRDILKVSVAVAGMGLAGTTLAETPAGVSTDTFEPNGRWTVEKAQAWGKKQPWIVGCNYVPTYAVNQLEMWQKESFDAKIIDSELALAEKTGFNTLRVFMHHLLWQSDRNGFLDRVKTFLDICEKHGLQVIYTFFTNGGANVGELGPQPAPKPYTHNSQWRQTPGKDAVMHRPEQWHTMEEYVLDCMTTFRDDPRVRIWDLFNEPANSGDKWMTLGFLRLLWTWARQVNPPAPLTSAVQTTSAIQTLEVEPIPAFLVENSDILSFHHYGSKAGMEHMVKILLSHRRPVVCKEWLARGVGCTVFDILPLFKKYHVGAINWGLIPGKLQTHLPWGWNADKGEPKVWHHDLYREDHTPYDPKEIALYLKLVAEK
ncbi:MAG: cellulase family glycosylhydrolase [Planctomycetia bacterium]|nr:cellulase family glycosylhydrolase [Planctomycetia bacterium]